jgi:hypothetical protein
LTRYGSAVFRPRAPTTLKRVEFGGKAIGKELT